MRIDKLLGNGIIDEMQHLFGMPDNHALNSRPAAVRGLHEVRRENPALYGGDLRS